MLTEKRPLNRQVASKHRHTNEDVVMLREWAVKVRRAGFPGIIPQVYKGCSSIALHTSLSQHALSEHTGCHSELDLGDGLMNTKHIGKNTVLGLFRLAQEEIRLPSICWMIYTTQKEPNHCPEWRASLNEAFCQYSAVFPFHCLMTAVVIWWSYPAL